MYVKGAFSRVFKLQISVFVMTPAFCVRVTVSFQYFVNVYGSKIRCKGYDARVFNLIEDRWRKWGATFVVVLAM